MSFASYNTPISADGDLPVKLFDRKLNLKRLEAKKIKWLICYGLQDDLVEPQTALAPLDYIHAETTAFPKGHVAIATSWSDPKSAYGLHQRYEKEGAIGPVRFQLDLQAQLKKPKKRASSKAVKNKKVKATATAKAPPKARPGSKTKAKAVKAKAATKDKTLKN